MKVTALSELVRERSPGIKRLQWEDGLDLLRTNFLQSTQWNSDDSIMVSLAGFDFIDSDGLLWLLLIGDYLRKHNIYPWLELPTNKEQLGLLSESQFVQVAQELFSIVNIYNLEQDLPPARPSYLRFTKVDSVNLRAQLAFSGYHESIYNALSTTGSDEVAFEIVQPLVRFILETNRNLVQHSGHENGDGWGYFALAIQTRKRVPVLTFTVGDTGLGFRTSLRKKGLECRDDKEAIRKALLYRHFSPEGEGLFNAVRLASRLDGFVKLRSGRSSAKLNFTKTFLSTDDEVFDYIQKSLQGRNEDFDFPGVQLYIEARGVAR